MKLLNLLIARQRAMHAERDVVMANLSVCASNAAKQMDISSYFFDEWASF